MARRKGPPPKIVVEKHDAYRTIFQTGAYGGPRLGYFELVIYTDETVADETLSTIPPDPAKVYIKRTLQCAILMTPIQTKSLVELLNKQISQYEKDIGKIPTLQDLAKKGKKPPPPHMIT